MEDGSVASLADGLLKGKVAIVTGAASGIGRAIAEAYAQAGASVMAIDITDMGRAIPGISAHGGSVQFIRCDVSSESAVCQMIESVRSTHNSIDILVNNAGIFPFSDIESTSLEQWERVFAINTRGTFLCTRAVIPTMKENRRGKVINISSATFFIGLANSSAYVASKGAVIGFTRSAARELGSANIQVNTITPGLTRTPGVEAAGVTDEFFAAFAARQCLPRTQIAEDVVGAALFLASNQSDFVTGQIINVDGGLATN